MQSANAPSQKREGPKPKRPPRWRDLSDEEQWDRIYKDRKRQERAAPKSVAQAVALALPGYCLQMAIDDCHKTFQATIRHDVHTAIVASIATVAKGLKTEKKRQKMLTRLEAHYQSIKSTGFYMHNREFLYANAVALVKLVDDFRYPPDAPCCMAAIMLKEDAETDEEGDWALARVHANKMAEVAYDGYLTTELYRYPDGGT